MHLHTLLPSPHELLRPSADTPASSVHLGLKGEGKANRNGVIAAGSKRVSHLLYNTVQQRDLLSFSCHSNIILNPAWGHCSICSRATVAWKLCEPLNGHCVSAHAECYYFTHSAVGLITACITPDCGDQTPTVLPAQWDIIPIGSSHGMFFLSHFFFFAQRNRSRSSLLGYCGGFIMFPGLIFFYHSSMPLVLIWVLTKPALSPSGDKKKVPSSLHRSVRSDFRIAESDNQSICMGIVSCLSSLFRDHSLTLLLREPHI